MESSIKHAKNSAVTCFCLFFISNRHILCTSGWLYMQMCRIFIFLWKSFFHVKLVLYSNIVFDFLSRPC